MKVTQLETIVSGVHTRNYVYVRLHTDEGIIGIGEAAISGKEKALVGALEELSGYMVGQDPREVEKHWQSMYRQAFFRGGPVLMGAISGVEQAMWDIKGKILGVPVYELLGGMYRHKIKVYTHVGGDTPEQVAERAHQLLEKGFRALKIVPFDAQGPGLSLKHQRKAEARVRALREAVGDEVDLMVDCHGRLEPINAVEMAKRLEQYGLLFYEEPVLPEYTEAMASVAQKIAIPVATGERLYTQYPFRDLLVKGAAQVLQPDLSCVGGIMEGRKIATMADAFFAQMAPHNPLSPLNTVVSLHLDVVTPNFLIQEMVSGLADRVKVLTEPIELEVKDGYLPAPKGPGWGVELDMEFLKAHPYTRQQTYTRGGRYLEDGTVANL